jgi:hypothetical protein
MSSFPVPWRRLVTLPALVRFAEWYDSKLPPFVGAVAYAALAGNADESTRAGDLLALLALFVLYASFGHLVNDYADRDVDRTAGKARAFAAWPAQWAIAAIGLAGFATVAVTLNRFDFATVALTIVALSVAALYSLPPARLKEGHPGIVASALSQRASPAIAFRRSMRRIRGRAVLRHVVRRRRPLHPRPPADGSRGRRAPRRPHVRDDARQQRVARLVRRVVNPDRGRARVRHRRGVCGRCPAGGAFAVAEATIWPSAASGQAPAPVSYALPEPVPRCRCRSRSPCVALQDRRCCWLVVLVLVLQRDRLVRYARRFSNRRCHPVVAANSRARVAGSR